MNDVRQPARRTVVIGAGISGLAAAHRLMEVAPDREIIVLEASDRAGGLLRSERTEDGYLIERGPDSIITDKPWALALARRLGLDGDIVGTLPGSRGAYVVCRGRLERIPEGFSLVAPVRATPFLRSPILSWRGKARAGLDLVLPRGHREDESLAHFVTRRFGKEMLDRLAQPMVGGIYGADPEKLSLRATMPRFLDIEREHRSVSLGLRRRQRRAGEAHASGARYGLFVSFLQGCQRLPDALAERLGDRLRLRQSVRALARDPETQAWRITTEDGTTIDSRSVVVAIPAGPAADLLRPIDSDLARLLGHIPYGSAATATFAWRRKEIPHPLDAYGFVVPSIERRDILASTWASRKWPGRAPPGMELVRVFFGGPGRDHVVNEDDDTLVRWARRELGDLMGVTAEPSLVRVDRYVRAMPQYHVGHLGLVARIEAQVGRHEGLQLAGNAFRGVGIPDSVHRGELAAERVAAARV